MVLMNRFRTVTSYAFNPNVNLCSSMVAGHVSCGARQNDNYYLSQIAQITLIYGSVFDLKIYQNLRENYLNTNLITSHR